MAILLNAKFTTGATSTTFTLTFNAPVLLTDLTYYQFASSSLGTLDFDSVSLDVTSTIVTATTSTVVAATDYVSIVDMTNPYSGQVLIGGSGNNVIVGDDQVDVIFANEGVDFIDGRGNTDVIYLTETTKAIDTVKLTDWGSNAHGEDMVYGFDVSAAATNDKLNMASRTIAAAAPTVDGTDVGTIAKHTIGAGGIVSFQTSAGAAIVIDTELEASNAVAYLEKNLTTAGTTVAFRYDIDANGTNDGLCIFQKSAPFNDSTAVSLENIGAVATLGTAAAVNVVKIEDTRGPEIGYVETTANGVKFYFNEKVASASLGGVALYKNGTVAMGTATQALDSTATIATLTTGTALLATDYVELKFDPAIANYATDTAGNKALTQPEHHGLIIDGAGTNTINLSAKTKDYSVLGNAGNDTITGTSYGDMLDGGDGDDKLNGGGGSDELSGEAGNDTLNGGMGYDEMRGGLGNDTYIVSGYDDVYERTGEGTDLVKSYDYSYGLTFNVENLQLMLAGTSGYGNDLNNIIYAGRGNNTINGGSAGVDGVSYLYAKAGVTAILTSLTTGTATIAGITGSDTLSNIDNLTGSSFVDSLTGNDAANVLNGGVGADTMAGGLGNDTYYVDDAGDVVTENVSAGTDTILSSISYTASTNVENLTLTGTAVINATGNTLNNTLTGNSAANVLNGAAGNDTLNGGLGNDTLTGGTGLDAFIFNTALNASTNLDAITDFVVADDTIKLENAIFTKLTTTGTLAAANFVIGAAPVDTNDYVIYNSATGALSYDADGSGTVSAAVQIATLGTGLALTNADFVVI